MISASIIPVVVAAAAAIEMTESSNATVMTAAVVVITGQRAGRKEGQGFISLSRHMMVLPKVVSVTWWTRGAGST